MRQRFIVLILVIAFLAGSSGSNRHLICKTIGDVFSERGDDNQGSRNESILRASQGRSGKRGPVGPMGLHGSRGLKGEPGYVDYDNITDIVERKVCEGLNSVVSRLNAILEDISYLQSGQNKLRCLNGFLYNGTCYKSPGYSTSSHMNREQAMQACHKIGYKFAKILDRTHQEALEGFVRPLVPSGEKYFWTDSTYDHATKSLHYESGEQITSSLFTWFPGYPKSNENYQYIFLGVRKSGNDGIFNYSEFKVHGVICEKKL